MPSVSQKKARWKCNILQKIANNVFYRFFLAIWAGDAQKQLVREPEKGGEQRDRRVGWELQLVRSLPEIHGIEVDEQPNGTRHVRDWGRGRGQVRTGSSIEDESFVSSYFSLVKWIQTIDWYVNFNY
jgi:hypothetical protein